MDDDFILPEAEPPDSPRRNLLLTVVALLAAFILLSLCAIGLLVAEKREELLASFGTQPTLTPVTPIVQGTSPGPSPSRSAADQAEEIVADQTPPAESSKEAYRIVSYGERRVPFRVVWTATPHNPHRIIHYYNSVSEEGGQ
jgi:hypothetical protein